MSHRKLLLERMNAHVEAGKYRAKGTARTKEEPPKEAAPAPPREAEQRPTPKPADSSLDPGGLVQSLSRRRVDAVGESVHKALNDKFVADTIASSLPTLAAAADIKVKEGLGAGLASHGLPTTLVTVTDWITGLVGKLGGK